MDPASKEKALEKRTTRQDAIRVENIRKERHYAKEWLKRWGFLAQGEQREDALQAFCQGRSYEETKRQLSKIMKDGVRYDAEKCCYDPHQWYREVKDTGPQNKYLHPATASQEVGWRTNESLEKFGVNHYGYKKKTADIQPARLKNAQPNASGL